MKNRFILTFCVFFLTAAMLLSACSGGGDTPEPETNAETAATTLPATEPPAEATTETTTAAPTTTELDKKNYHSDTPSTDMQVLSEILTAGVFYIDGEAKMHGGETMQLSINSDGENTRTDLTSKGMKMAFISIGESFYIANTSTNTYVEITEETVRQLGDMLRTMSVVNFTGEDIQSFESMVDNFDRNADYSSYFDDAEYEEYYTENNGEEYLVGVFRTENGTARLYTQDGMAKILDLYDQTGLRQVSFTVGTFVPLSTAPVSLNGMTRGGNLLNLFG
ncbi:MAG: hypothetical protein K6G90_14330 [Clostridia bacterium]|nr:hypothetical protein [Clostridia bacterium]